MNATTPSAGASVKNADTVPFDTAAGCVVWPVTRAQPLILAMINTASEQKVKLYFLYITASLTFDTWLGYELGADNSAGRGARNGPVQREKRDLCHGTGRSISFGMCRKSWVIGAGRSRPNASNMHVWTLIRLTSGNLLYRDKNELMASPVTRAAMRYEEYERLRDLLNGLKPNATLEIGMASGGSSEVICETMQKLGRGKHTAIDPFQTSLKGWKRQGVERIRRAGLSQYFDLIEDFDYLALPRLLLEQRSFDFVLIDGWHSFDYTLLDFFYADLLVTTGGIISIHDTGRPAVYKVCRFIETHKPYDLLSPAPAVELRSLPARGTRRMRQWLVGEASRRAARSRRTEWFSLVAYRKRESHQVPDQFFAEF